MNVLLTVCLTLALPPDHSSTYFSGLSRPHAPALTMSRDDGPIILIVVDAMRPDRLTPYGFARPTSPNLQSLADEGLVLTNYYVNANWTRPSMASLLTGLPPYRHQVERDSDRLSENFVTLPEVLRDAGIPTGAVVGNGNAAGAFGLAQGFSFFADTTKHWHGLPSARQVVDVAQPFIREHRDEPFFLMLFFVDPHDPYRAPGRFDEMFVSDPTVPLIRSPHWELGRYSQGQIERMQAAYDGAVRYTDTVLGEFFTALRAMKIYDESTIIVTADHSEAFGEHGKFLHSHHLYDEIIRAPLIIKAPRMGARGSYNHYLFQSIDLLPTIVSLYGLSLPGRLPGVNIVSHLEVPNLNDNRGWIVSEFHNFGIDRQTLRTYSEKVIYEAPANAEAFLATVREPSLLPSVSFDSERVHLYDMARDPYEQTALLTAEYARKPRWAGLLDVLRRQHDRRLVKPSSQAQLELVDGNSELEKDLRSLGYIQ